MPNAFTPEYFFILARLAGFEPATLGLEDRYSIHMSYRRKPNLIIRCYIFRWSGQEDLNL